MAQPTDFNDLININLDDFVRGADVSHHNSNVNWSNLSQKIDFCYIKLSDGPQYIDGYAQTHASGAKAHGISIGFYHFARPEDSPNGDVDANAKQQAKRVLDCLSELNAMGITADLPLALDLENVGGGHPWDTNLDQENYMQWIKTFATEVFDPVINAKPVVLYSRTNYLRDHLPEDHSLSIDHPLWISRYNKDCDVLDPETAGWANWDIWQFTEQGLLLPDDP